MFGCKSFHRFLRNSIRFLIFLLVLTSLTMLRTFYESIHVRKKNKQTYAQHDSKYGVVIRDAPRSSEVSQRTSSDQIQQLNAIPLEGTALEGATRKCQERRRTQCNPRLPWRTGDGRCNNLQNPHWGRANFCMTRLLPPAYENGIDEPRGGRFNSRLPNPRVISRVVNVHRNVSAPNYTHMVMQIGQFLDHDTALAPMEEDPGEIINLGSM